MKKFVFAKKNIKITNLPVIERNDVGIIQADLNKKASVFFIRTWHKVVIDKSELQMFDVQKTGDGFRKKICNVCHKLKNTREFAKNQNAKNNRSVRRPSCRKCRKELEGVSVSNADRRKWRKSKPMNEPFECPICLKRTIAGITSKVVLEHDHKTGRVRGWVCDSCNTGIGRFKDNIRLLKRAIKFIKSMD